MRRSIEFCTQCHKCPSSCTKSCRVKIARVLGKMGSLWHQSQGGIIPQRGLHSTLSVQTLSDKKTHNNKLLSRSSQEQLPAGGIASAVKQKRCRIGSKSTVTGVLQPVIPYTKTKQPVASHLGSEQTKQLFENTVIQYGDSRDNTHLPRDRGVGDLHRLQRRILPYTDKQSVQEVYMRFHIQDRTYQFKALPFGLPTAPMEFTVIAKEVKWLAMRKVFNFVVYQFNLREGRVRPTTECWQTLQVKIREILTNPVYPEFNVPDQTTDCHRKASTHGQVTYETHTVASQKQLESTGNTGEDHPHSKITPPTSRVLTGGKKQVVTGQPLHPLAHALQIFTDTSKEGWGAHVNKHMARGSWSLPESKLHINYLELKAVLLALKKRISSTLYKQCSSHGYRQHYCGSLHKQGRGNEVGAPVCLTLENTDLVYQKSSNSESSTHSHERNSRQAMQTGPNHSNGMVPQSRDVPSNMQPVAQTPSRLICPKVQQQTSTVCLTSPGPLGSGCCQSVMGGAGPLRLSTSSHLGQSGGEVAGLPLQQDHSDCPRVAQHALVLGSSGNVQSYAPRVCPTYQT